MNLIIKQIEPFLITVSEDLGNIENRLIFADKLNDIELYWWSEMLMEYWQKPIPLEKRIISLYNKYKDEINSFEITKNTRFNYFMCKMRLLLLWPTWCKYFENTKVEKGSRGYELNKCAILGLVARDLEELGINPNKLIGSCL